nr:MAG: major capsid protein [Microviridae sp.]
MRGKGNIFQKVKLTKPRRSTHDLSYDNKLTLNFGDLVPVYCEDVVPGDSFRVSSEFFVRFMPMVAPIMHSVNVHMHYFYVPYRLCWRPFNDWIKDYANAAAPTVQRLRLNDALSYADPSQTGVGSLWDYLGLPPLSGSDYGTQSILPFRFTAYQLIYNEYYRDQNLADEILLPVDDNGIIDSSYVEDLLTVRKRAWEKDYFTSALPWPQRGADVHLPLTGDAPVSGTASISGLTDLSRVDNEDMAQSMDNVQYVRNTDPHYAHLEDGVGNSVQIGGSLASIRGSEGPIGLKADMSQVTAATINDLRKANALQRWFEMSARAGNRVKEFFLSNFGTAPADLRIDRPEYLGGGKQPVVIQDIDQTSSSDSTSPQANMAGKAGASGSTPSFTKHFTEHGVIIGIMSITPRSSYQDGMPRCFTKFDQLDYFFPIFQHLGEQEIKNSEIFFSENLSENVGTFGYTPRYAEYKYHGSEIHGDFRSSLDFWHLGRKFASIPPLSKEFVEVNPEYDELNRIFANTDSIDAHLIAEVFNSVRAIRPMDYYSIPSLI